MENKVKVVNILLYNRCAKVVLAHDLNRDEIQSSLGLSNHH